MLNNGLLFYFILDTILITACGYLINDYFDFDGDKINQKANRFNKRIVYLAYYFLLLFLGLFLSFYIAYKIGNVYLITIFLVATIGLFFYSSHLKRLPLIGNLFVALYSTFVLCIILFFEYPAVIGYWNSVQDTAQSFFIFIAFYMIFMFLLSFLREIIKDLEDKKGDAISNAMTIAVINENKAITFIKIGSVILLGATIVFCYYQLTPLYNVISLILIVLPQLILMTKIIKENRHYTHLSLLCKVNMFLGLFYLVTYNILSV